MHTQYSTHLNPSLNALSIYHTFEPLPQCTVNISHISTPPSMHSQYITHLSPTLNTLSIYHTLEHLPQCTLNTSYIWTPPSMHSQYITHLHPTLMQFQNITHLKPTLNTLTIYHTFININLTYVSTAPIFEI